MRKTMRVTKKILASIISATMIIGTVSTGAGAVDPDQPTVSSVEYTFEDDSNNEYDIYDTGITTELVSGMNSNAGYSQDKEIGGNNCLKITNRKSGKNWWEYNGFAYDLKNLTPGNTYTVSIDVYHENDAIIDNDTQNVKYNENRVFKMGTRYTGSELSNSPKNYDQISNTMGAKKGVWERVTGKITIPENIYYGGGDYFLYIGMYYPEAIDNYGYYRDMNREDYYIDNFIIEPYDNSDEPDVNPSDKKYHSDYVGNHVLYQQKNEITRWYDDANAAHSTTGHAHDGYKNNDQVLWSIGSYDNEFSTIEEEYIDNEAIRIDSWLDCNGNKIDMRERKLHLTGEFMYEGTPLDSVYLQLSCTTPRDYPIMWKWEKGASSEQSKDATMLRIDGGGSEEAKPGEWNKVDITFTVPKNAVNADKDPVTGESLGIYMYFASRPNGALTYDNSNTFHFRNFKLEAPSYTVPYPSPTITSSPGPIPTWSPEYEQNEPTIYGINNPRISKDGSVVWDKITFGNYYKENNEEKEPIEWRVLSVDGDEALILSEKGLDCIPYNESAESVTWETSSIRTWLNDYFYNEAFNEIEQSAIKEVTIENDDNPSYGTDGGNDTIDKIYLLSAGEASTLLYGFESNMYRNSTTRDCYATNYAILNGATNYNFYTTYCWWLRTIGFNNSMASIVNYDSNCGEVGKDVDSNYIVVRPALRIDLNSSEWTKTGETGTHYNSIYFPTPTPVPTAEPTQTPEPTVKPTEEPTQSPESTAKPTTTPQATSTPDVTQTPEPTAEPTSTPEPTKTPEVTPTPSPSPSQAPAITATPTPAPVSDNTQSADDEAKLKTIKLSSVVCKRNTTKISGKVSVSGATVKIKVGSKAYKKAAVKGKKFTLKVAKLKKKTKVIIKVTKSGYKSLSKTYKVK